MLNTIIGRLTIAFGLILLLIISIFGVTQYVVSKQKDDGLIVNLSGRQRMLTQRMTKETLIYANELKVQKPEGLDKKREKVLDTIQIFDTTHNALWKGGNAPLTLSMKDTTFRSCPPAASVEIANQLQVVDSLWKPLKADIESYLKQEDSTVLARITVKNNELLKEMHKTVGMMQKDAESKVSIIFWVQILALVFGALIIVIALKSTKTSVITPINKLKESAESISTGELSKDIEKFNITEINDLGQSFNRMRLSMITMMELEEEDALL